jgi:hypothetical protein
MVLIFFIHFFALKQNPMHRPKKIGIFPSC